MAGKPLRLLLIEDSAEDAQLLLRRGGYDVTDTRVETAAAMRTALESQPWELVIADHALPNFSAPAALEIAPPPSTRTTSGRLSFWARTRW